MGCVKAEEILEELLELRTSGGAISGAVGGNNMRGAVGLRMTSHIHGMWHATTARPVAEFGEARSATCLASEVADVLLE